MSWQCTSWALREAPCPTATARLVLISLADRCQPDGRSAWPTVETLMEEAHTSESSVRRALKGLEEMGAIRRGNQELAKYDEHGRFLPEQYRPIVWECCMDVALEQVAEKPGRQARAEREKRRQDGKNSRPVKMTGQNDGDDSRPVTGDTSRPVTGDTPIRKTNNQTNIPSTPSGYLPDDGEPEPDDDGWTEAEATTAIADTVDADAILSELEQARQARGLSVRPRTARDRAAIERLAGRLGSDAWTTMRCVLHAAYDGNWWPKIVTDGRRFAKHFDRICDDMTIDADRTTPADTGGTGTTAGRCAASGHTRDCEHVRRLLTESAILTAAEPDRERRLGWGAQAAGGMNGQGDSNDNQWLFSLAEDMAQAREHANETDIPTYRHTVIPSYRHTGNKEERP